jgi:hypothetical protein
MDEGQAKGVQHLTRGAIPGQFAQGAIVTDAVRRITHDGKSQVLEVDPNLMSAARVEYDFDEGRAAEPIKDMVTGSRLAANVLADGHALAVRGMAGDRGGDFSPVARQFAAHHGKIELFN